MGKRPRSEQNKGGAGPTAPGGKGGHGPGLPKTVLLEAPGRPGPFNPPCKFRRLLLRAETLTSAQNSCTTLAEEWCIDPGAALGP